MSDYGCVLTDCMDFYTGFSTCTGGTFTVNPQDLTCLCSTTAIAAYTKCYPCLQSLYPASTTLTVQAYTNSCANKNVFNPYIPSVTSGYGNPSYPVPTPTSTSGGNTGGTTGDSTSGNNSGGGTNIGMIIGIVAGVLVVLGLVTFFVIRSRRKPKDQKTESYTNISPNPPPYTQQQQQQQQPYPTQAAYTPQYVTQPQTNVGYYVDPNTQQQYQIPDQQQHQQGYYPVVSAPAQVQPTPSPTLVTTAPHYDQQQQQQQIYQQQAFHHSQSGIASVGNIQGPPPVSSDYHAPPIPIPMPGQSQNLVSNSPVTTALSSATVYEPSPTVSAAHSKPAILPGPQYYEPVLTQSNHQPQNPQYIGPPETTTYY